MRLLEMSGPEIEEAVRNEIDDNPALEAGNEYDTEQPHNEGDEAPFNETAESMQAADYADEDDTPAYLLHASNKSADDSYVNPYERQHAGQSLLEALSSQLDMIDAPANDIAIARYLIGYLDEHGRLSRTLREIANDVSIATSRNIDRNQLLPALDIIRYQLDPPGLGASDLRECLLIQLRRRQPKTLAVKAAQEIITDYFDLFIKKHFEKIRSAMGVSKETVENAIAVIKTLDPKPGSSFDDNLSDRISHITPDFLVVPPDEPNGTYTISLNQHLPELAVEQSFRADNDNKEASMFIRRKRDEATTFIGLIKRRSDTLMAVMKAIVKLQRHFFSSEDQANLRPMILDDISRLTGLDRSVISRATSNKYVATPTAVYPLKMFFNDTPTEDSDVSSKKIVADLRKIIDGENKHKPLSDRALTEALNARGYALARRTVTKYREKNNIPVARLRKEY